MKATPWYSMGVLGRGWAPMRLSMVVVSVQGWVCRGSADGRLGELG